MSERGPGGREGAPSDVVQVVVFRLGTDLFGADVYSVERVLRYQPPRAIPNVPDWLEGVVDYQGRVVPVVDLRRRFELPRAGAGATARVLVLQVESEWVGAIVDAVTEVATVDAAAVAPPPSLFRGLAGEYIKGIVRRGEELIVLLDVTRILSTNERIALERVATEAGGDDAADTDAGRGGAVHHD